MEGKNGPTHFCLKYKNRWTDQIHQRKGDKCLTDDQARHVYQKVESGSIINVDTIRQEINQDIDRIDGISGKINPYCKIVVNKVEKDNTILSQMEQ